MEIPENETKKRGREVRSPPRAQEQTTTQPQQEHEILSPPRRKQNSGTRSPSSTLQFGCNIQFTASKLIRYLMGFISVKITSIQFSSNIDKPEMQYAICRFPTAASAVTALKELTNQKTSQLLPPITFQPTPAPITSDNIADRLCDMPPDGQLFITPPSCIVERCSHATGPNTTSFPSAEAASTHYKHFHPDLVKLVFGKTATWRNYLGWGQCPNNRCQQLFFCLENFVSTKPHAP